MIARGYQLHHLKPSDVKWLEECMHFKHIEEAFIHKVRTYLLNGGECIASLDTVWCDGIQLHKTIDIIGYDAFVAELTKINTKRKDIFLQGVRGQPFNPRLADEHQQS